MSLYPTEAWAETSPAGSDQINAGDNRIRQMKTQIREIIGVDHDFPSSGQAADNGQHLRVTLQEQADLGTGAVGATILGSQTIATKGELVYTDEDDNDIQITKAGEINVEAISDAIITTPLYIAIANLLYPVGKVVTLGVSTNPGTLFGIGTWTAIAGKVIVGIDATQTEFDTLDETGGSKTKNISHTHLMAYAGYANAGGANGAILSEYGDGGLPITRSGGSTTQDVMNPYTVKYVWQRTA
jgi:hypothetical protein